jgi:hypothetical protein
MHAYPLPCFFWSKPASLYMLFIRFFQLEFIDSLTAGSTLVVAGSKLRLPFRYHGTRASKEY